ncbi:hypothetical protein SAMN05660282_00938 [Corynebacterium spheniscorum]|uniref:Uncharacterized protein n=1 Tax=Corynebacterium spheniscorum TaxID=185761 RepID=A0A1I2RZJ2_9CORY|nr:hypothetical protein SAMN05660282_00938 [Corynebacterium spheniscorum]
MALPAGYVLAVKQPAGAVCLAGGECFASAVCLAGVVRSPAGDPLGLAGLPVERLLGAGGPAGWWALQPAGYACHSLWRFDRAYSGYKDVSAAFGWRCVLG